MNNENYLKESLNRIEKKLNIVEGKLRNINSFVDPPLWKKFIGFWANNFFIILTLISLVIIYWKFWELYQTLMLQLESLNGSIQTVKNIPQSAGNTILNIVESLGF